MIFKRIVANSLIISMLCLAGCARDLSSKTYTSDSTLNLTLQGKIISANPVVVKNSDLLEDNVGGIASGAALGGIGGSAIGQGKGNMGMVAAGVIAGGLVGGAVGGQLGKANGIEYIVKVDRSNLKDEYYQGSAMMRDAIAAVKANGILTIVQGSDNPIAVGKDVFIIISSKRARVVSQ